MRWVRHMTTAWDDERIAKAVGAGGVEGLAAYGLWWRIVEIVAGRMNPKTSQCSVTYHVSRWSVLLSLRGSHVRHWVEKLALTGVLTAEWVESELTVTIPKLLKYRDEYSQKSRHSPDTNTDTEQRQIKNTINPIVPSAAASDRLKAMGWAGVAKTPEDVCEAVADIQLVELPESRALDSPYMIVCRLNWFRDFWAYYWRHDDVRKARAKYFEKVTSAELQEIVESAVIAQAPEMERREKQYRKLAATWLNQECWRNQPLILPEGEGE